MKYHITSIPKKGTQRITEKEPYEIRSFPKPIKKEKVKKILRPKGFNKSRIAEIQVKVLEKKGVKVKKSKLSPIRKTTLSKAKQKAWKAFSIYIRTKDSVDGFNVCYTCDSEFDIKKMNAGHGIGGRNNAILFDERIVRPQCVGCNVWGRGQYQVFTRKLIGELGLKKYDEIVKHSSDTKKMKIQDYEEIEKHFKELITNKPI